MHRALAPGPEGAPSYYYCYFFFFFFFLGRISKPHVLDVLVRAHSASLPAPTLCHGGRRSRHLHHLLARNMPVVGVHELRLIPRACEEALWSRSTNLVHGWDKIKNFHFYSLLGLSTLKNIHVYCLLGLSTLKKCKILPNYDQATSFGGASASLDAVSKRCRRLRVRSRIATALAEAAGMSFGEANSLGTPSNQINNNE